MLKVLFLTKYTRMGASSRLRALQYIPSLEKGGVDVTVSCFFGEDYLEDLYHNSRRSPLKLIKNYFQRFWLLIYARDYDVVWIEKELFPYLPAVAERWLRVLGVPYVVDYDDAVFHNYDLSGNSWIRRLLGGKIDSVMRASSCVVAGNEYLASRARSAGAKRVEIIPTVVDYTRYRLAPRGKRGKLVIGWIGSPSTQKYVLGIQDALREVCLRYDARVLLVGATEGIVDEMPGIDVEVAPWSEEGETGLIEQMDVGIMPLIDGPWEKGKCGYKLIQYMACAVPVVASPVGVNVDIVANSSCGLLASGPEQWSAALSQLLGAELDRTQLGQAGRHAVEIKYSLQAQAPVLKSLFHSLSNSK